MSSDDRVLTPEGLQAVRRWHLALAAVLLGLVLFLPGLARFRPVQCLACGGTPAVAAAPAAPVATPAAAVTAPTPALATPTPPAAETGGAASAVAAAPAAPAPASAPAAAPAAAATVAPVSLYYASGAWGLPAKADAALAPLVAALKARPGAQIVISGFHDASGDPRRNHDLALKRARAVAQALQAAGVEPARIDLVKPQQTTGGSDPAQARRVEVSLRG